MPTVTGGFPTSVAGVQTGIPVGVPTHAHQLKNENKMNFRSNKLKHVMYFWY